MGNNNCVTVYLKTNLYEKYRNRYIPIYIYSYMMNVLHQTIRNIFNRRNT